MTSSSHQPGSNSIMAKLFGPDINPYKIFFDNGNDGFFVYFPLPDGMPNTFVEVNNKACEMLGYSRDDLLKRSPQDLVIPEKWDEVLTIVEKKKQADGSLVFETILACRNGRHIEVEICDHSFVIDGRNIIFSIVRDQTARKESERCLQRAEIEWNNTFDSITDFVSVHSVDQKIVRANNALVDALGRSREEIIGRYCYQIFHNNDEPIQGCPHIRAMETGELSTTIINDSKTGLVRQIFCSPYFDHNGDLAGTVHVARDFSESQQAAEENERLISELNSALAEVKQLSGFLPICASCKKIRGESGAWHHVETYIMEHSEAAFSHGLCPDCAQKLYPFLDHQKKE